MSQRRSVAGHAGLFIGVLLMAIWSFFPIYWMIVSSLRPERDIFSVPSLIPKTIDPGLQSYKNLLHLTDYWQQFMNSLIVAGAVVAVSLVVSVVVAYVVSRFKVPGKSLIISSMLYAYMFPPLLLAIPLLAIFARWGLADSLFSVVVAHCTMTIPLGVWLLWGFFKAMPMHLEEAAMVDGCTRAQAFYKVVLPLSLPGIVTVAIFSFLLSWTDYVFAFVLLSSDSQQTLPVGLAAILGSFDARWGELMAGATLITLPLLVMFTFLSRYFIQGLAAGAVKG
ncbi:carbohydrate ABC transporter permease [Schauerella aestuarii]|uniref:carbohydrate ABC transporter permease n=1 Tax=Schauerella aestuarii TaxID=2511204 RepID=UPI00136C12D9|nr:carbohydrate ABC transporter permease [Achromobacter aestuarii]MYZ43062.1 carbohydrate ABC transporter permease [Achromobacter aestuarii]